ncbi:hypothetical protein OHT57_10895 [Streptomyces sp. NBC_00285]|uniref:hypothetical protein n=1 Tax=Streptomyces sp. NBC_00285 TaxID=2975700 RepID=UPI002E28C189|nr:hypothetical protein [Streptomyces sp. NBC_00285]
MHLTRIRTSPRESGRDLTPLFAGAATATGGLGALLALTGSDSPLRAPLVLFFLLAAPAAGIAAVLRGLDPFARALTALAGSVVLNMLVAQGMLATHRWSARGGVVAMAVISSLILLLVLVPRRRTAKGRDD